MRLLLGILLGAVLWLGVWAIFFLPDPNASAGLATLVGMACGVAGMVVTIWPWNSDL